MGLPVLTDNRDQTPDSRVFVWYRICSIYVVVEKQNSDCQIRSFGGYGHAAGPGDCGMRIERLDADERICQTKPIGGVSSLKCEVSSEGGDGVEVSSCAKQSQSTLCFRLQTSYMTLPPKRLTASLQARAILRNKANSADCPNARSFAGKGLGLIPRFCETKDRWCAQHTLRGGPRTYRAKQSQFAPENALRRHYERRRSCETKPICPGGQMVCTAHPTGLRTTAIVRNKPNVRGRLPVNRGCGVRNKANLWR